MQTRLCTSIYGLSDIHFVLLFLHVNYFLFVYCTLVHIKHSKGSDLASRNQKYGRMAAGALSISPLSPRAPASQAIAKFPWDCQHVCNNLLTTCNKHDMDRSDLLQVVLTTVILVVSNKVVRKITTQD